VEEFQLTVGAIDILDELFDGEANTGTEGTFDAVVKLHTFEYSLVPDELVALTRQ
jgi:hypothetical protein